MKRKDVLNMYMDQFGEDEVKSYSLAARIGVFVLAAAFPIPSLLYRYFNREKLNNQEIRLKLPIKCGSSMSLMVLVFYFVVLLVHQMMY